MIRFLCIACLIFSMSISAKNIYSWTDRNGVTHFSDILPQTNAKIHSLPTVSSLSPQQSVNLTPKMQKHDYRSKKTPKLSIKIISPTNGETIRDNNGAIEVKTQLNRPLLSSEHLQLFMDNKPIGAPSTKKVWLLENIDRGTHRFLIQLVVSGKVIASSSLVTVYLHRASVN